MRVRIAISHLFKKLVSEAKEAQELEAGRLPIFKIVTFL